MTNMQLIAYAIAFLSGFLLTSIMRQYAIRSDLLDVPNDRSSHDSKTPRGGGVSIVVIFLTGALALAVLGRMEWSASGALVVAGATIAGVGYIDDRRGVSIRIRLAVQVGCAIVAVGALGGLPPVVLGDYVLEARFFGDVFLVLLFVWFTNAFNFMDGIDGIAAIEAISICIGGFALILMSGIGDPTLFGIAAAATLGFLPWNWAPAKIFLGDVGSAFLGYSLFFLAVYFTAAGVAPIWSWLILAAVFFTDATTTLLFRAFDGQVWYAPHNSHAYQKAARRVGNHWLVSLLVLLTNLAWLLPLALAAQSYPRLGWLIMIVAYLPLAIATILLRAGRIE